MSPSTNRAVVAFKFLTFWVNRKTLSFILHQQHHLRANETEKRNGWMCLVTHKHTFQCISTAMAGKRSAENRTITFECRIRSRYGQNKL